MEYKEMLKKIAVPMVEKIASDIELEETNKEDAIREKLAQVHTSEQEQEQEEVLVDLDQAIEKTASFFEEGEIIKNAAEEVYAQGQLIEDAIIALYSYYNN